MQGVRGWVGVSTALLGGEIADAGQEMTPFPQPIELDAVLDTTWEPVAEVVLRKVGRGCKTPSSSLRAQGFCSMF